jgi:very-short-patch-repair endonuclease
MKKLTAKYIINRKMFNNIEENTITERHLNEIDKILKKYDNKTIKNRLKNIHDFIKYNVDGCWLERINIIRTVLKNDVTSDYALEIRYGKKNVEKKKKDFSSKFGHSLEKYKKKYGELLGKIKWEEYLKKSKTPWGLDACIEKFGKIKGPKKWDERLSRKNKTMSERKLIKPYRNGRTLKEYQNRYGIEEGFIKWDKRNKKQSYRFSKKYYINTFGEKVGNEKWNEYRKRMNLTSLDSFIKRYGKKKGIEKFNTYISKCFKSGSFYSKISQELFFEIYNKLTENIKKGVRFAKLNGEEVFHVNQDDLKIIMVDFKCGNRIIEFDGDYWHDNTKQKIIDKKRDEYLKSKGYNIMRIWESEYLKNKNKIINKCLKFINE